MCTCWDLSCIDCSFYCWIGGLTLEDFDLVGIKFGGGGLRKCLNMCCAGGMVRNNKETQVEKNKTQKKVWSVLIMSASFCFFTGKCLQVEDDLAGLKNGMSCRYW